MQQEKVIETKICNCWASFDITDKDIEFYKNVSPVFNSISYDIPTPTLCPDCRNQRRLSWRNERNLYKRKSDATWKNMISIYSPDKQLKVYEQSEFWSDKWNPLDYSRDFDFTKTFAEQFKSLISEVPRLWILVTLNENSDYTNWTAYNKNCYLIFASDHNEDCSYCDNIFRCKDTYDSSDVTDSTNVYECIWTNNSSEVFFSSDCHNCRNMYFSIDCKNCSDCLLSYNLRNKK